MLHGVGMGRAFNQITNEGIYYLYRGMLPPLCQKGLSVSLMFGGYGDIYKRLRNQVRLLLVLCLLIILKSLIIEINFQNLTYGTSLCLAGIGAGVLEGVLTPFERMQTLLQVSKYHDKFHNTKHLFSVIIREHSIKVCLTNPILIILMHYYK